MKHLKQILFFIPVLLLIFYTQDIKAETTDSGLKIDQVFQRYGKKRNVTMVELSNEMLDTYDMRHYKSISIKDDAEALEFIRKCLDHDQQGARKIKEIIDNGNIVSAYYQLKPASGGFNRFILFNVNAKKLITLIYIEGDLDSEDLVTLLLSM